MEVETICANVFQFQVETTCSGAQQRSFRQRISFLGLTLYSYSDDSDTFTTSHTLQSDTHGRYNFLVVKAEHSNGR